MIVALCLYKYFPYGGLQRDFMRITKTIATHGHHIRVYTRAWQGECLAELEYVDVPVTAHSNHGRDKQYQTWVQQHLTQYPADRVLGFNKMPRLDYYYAADVCYAAKVAKEKGLLYRLTARYRHYAAFEQAVFKPRMKTKLLMLTTKQVLDPKMYYHTENERFQLLPPGIYPDRKYSSQAPDSRGHYREAIGIAPDHFLLLQVGSDFSRKGVGRLIAAVAALPEATRRQIQLFVVGQDKPRAFAAQTERMGAKENVHLFARRDDAAHLMAAADVLLHPAGREVAGIALVEAIVAGLLVLVTEVCGYALHVAAAGCGVVLSEPFEQHAFDGDLHKALADSSLREKWAKSARHHADTQDLYGLPEHVADIITGELYG